MVVGGGSGYGGSDCGGELVGVTKLTLGSAAGTTQLRG